MFLPIVKIGGIKSSIEWVILDESLLRFIDKWFFFSIIYIMSLNTYVLLF